MLTVFPFPWLLNLHLALKVGENVRESPKVSFRSYNGVPLEKLSDILSLKPQNSTEHDCACSTK